MRDDERLVSTEKTRGTRNGGIKTAEARSRPPGISNDFRLQAVISDYTYLPVVLFAFSFAARETGSR